MSTRQFRAMVTAEDFINEMVFGGDDADIVGEVVEVWPSEDAWVASWGIDGPKGWGTLYAVWGTEAQVEGDIARLGEFIDRKGMTGRADLD